jgi:S-adenosylmethionine/arginine decarboxylase-like enzyme
MKHKHLIIRAECHNPPRYEQNLTDWVKALVRDIDMKILMGPFATYCDVTGNKGFTCVTIIETSHIAVHVWDELQPSLVQVDVYTCGELDPQVVFDAVEKWDCEKMDYKYLDRETDLIQIIDNK